MFTSPLPCSFDKGAVSAVMVYKLFDKAYTIGTDDAVPAPAGMNMYLVVLLSVVTVSNLQQMRGRLLLSC
jgi:hypothetical protein